MHKAGTSVLAALGNRGLYLSVSPCSRSMLLDGLHDK